MMATEKETLGKLGEDLACKYLQKKGYKIIERNYWQPWGELDIVAVSPEKILVCVEIKTVKGNPPAITGEDQFTKAKSRKFKRTAKLYANISKYLTDKGWRVDLITIAVRGEQFDLKHYENV